MVRKVGYEKSCFYMLIIFNVFFLIFFSFCLFTREKSDILSDPCPNNFSRCFVANLKHLNRGLRVLSERNARYLSQDGQISFFRNPINLSKWSHVNYFHFSAPKIVSIWWYQQTSVKREVEKTKKKFEKWQDKKNTASFTIPDFLQTSEQK